MSRMIIGACLLALSGSALAVETGRFPADWFLAPEQVATDPNAARLMREVEEREGVTYRRGEPQVTKTIDTLLEQTMHSLDQAHEYKGRTDPPPNAPADWRSWYLKTLELNLGASAAGTIGLITGEGEVSAEVKWKRTAAGLRKVDIDPTTYRGNGDGESPSDLLLTDASTNEEIEGHVNQMVKAVMATGKVSDGSRLHDGLLKTAKDLQELMVDINSMNYSNWRVAKFMLDVSISGSGMVYPGVQASAALRLRFEWKYIPNLTNTLRRAPNNSPNDARESMRKLLATVAKDLQTGVKAEAYRDSGFDLKAIRLGVGVAFGANIGIVKGKLEVTGYVYFSLDPNYAPGPHRYVDLYEDIPLVDLEVKPAYLTYADQQHVKYARVPPEQGGAEKVVYYMDRARFRAGLDKATGLGAYFARRAKAKTGTAETTSNSWYVYEVKPQFAFSLTGNLLVATVGGKVSLEFTFARP